MIRLVRFIFQFGNNIIATKGFIVKVRDWEDIIDSDEEDNFEKFSHKTKLIRQRKEDIIKAKRREKQERIAYEESLTNND